MEASWQSKPPATEIHGLVLRGREGTLNFLAVALPQEHHRTWWNSNLLRTLKETFRLDEEKEETIANSRGAVQSAIYPSATTSTRRGGPQPTSKNYMCVQSQIKYRVPA
jgi:hypothetical protein